MTGEPERSGTGSPATPSLPPPIAPRDAPSRPDVISLKTAKARGLTIPPSLLLRADQVIE